MLLQIIGVVCIFLCALSCVIVAKEVGKLILCMVLEKKYEITEFDGWLVRLSVAYITTYFIANV